MIGRSLGTGIGENGKYKLKLIDEEVEGCFRRFIWT